MSKLRVLCSFLLINLCASYRTERGSEPTFEVAHEWHFVNFTWPDAETYNNAVTEKVYVPENVAVAGVKVYKDNIYLALPRIRQGVPATMGYFPRDSNKTDTLISPFPSWELNDQKDCSSLLNVQSMEIDKDGVMWVLDGLRTSAVSNCPPKLVLIDLNNDNEILKTFNFSDEICLTHGGFLNDIVVDDTDGGFAYITDDGSVDPGLIVYSRAQDRAWKLRDPSMFAEIKAANFSVNNLAFNTLSPIDGIALSPPDATGDRNVYYCALTGYNLYSISTGILKDENVVNGGDWRRLVKLIGAKLTQSDGMVVDAKGDLYYGLLTLYGVGRWNVNQPFFNEVVAADRTTMIWTDSFGFDEDGYLYLLTNNINKYFDPSQPLEITEEAQVRIFKYFTGTKSYLHYD